MILALEQENAPAFPILDTLTPLKINIEKPTHWIIISHQLKIREVTLLDRFRLNGELNFILLSFYENKSFLDKYIGRPVNKVSFCLRAGCRLNLKK